MTGGSTVMDGIRRASRPVILPVFWFSLGAAFVSYQLPVKKLDNVLVLKRRADGSLRAIADGTGEFETTTCAPNDFRPGEKFVYWRYENMLGCKSFRGVGRGYLAYTDAEGNRIKFPVSEEIANAR